MPLHEENFLTNYKSPPLLSHPFFMHSWLRSLWNDSSFWRIGAEPCGKKESDSWARTGHGRVRKAPQVIVGNYGGVCPFTQLGKVDVFTTSHNIYAGDAPHIVNEYTSKDGECDSFLASSACLSAMQTMPSVSACKFPFEAAILVFSLSLHQHPFSLLDAWRLLAPKLYIVDWAMPERNIDYFMHLLPHGLGLSSAWRTFRFFREFIKSGAEGVVEEYNARCEGEPLRQRRHKKYRWGSIIALEYS